MIGVNMRCYEINYKKIFMVRMLSCFNFLTVSTLLEKLPSCLTRYLELVSIKNSIPSDLIGVNLINNPLKTTRSR